MHDIPSFIQNQSPRGVPRIRCSENMQQIYKRIPIPKCYFNKVALHGCSPVNLLHISEHLCLLSMVPINSDKYTKDSHFSLLYELQYWKLHLVQQQIWLSDKMEPIFLYNWKSGRDLPYSDIMLFRTRHIIASVFPSGLSIHWISSHFSKHKM